MILKQLQKPKHDEDAGYRGIHESEIRPLNQKGKYVQGDFKP